MNRWIWRIAGWLWAWLPDRCEIPGCKRQNVRGNENRVPVAWAPGGYLIACDDCSVYWHHKMKEYKP